MKRKQVVAFLLCGTLTLGAATPVMAAEPEPAVEKTVEAGQQESQEIKPEVTGPDAGVSQETAKETQKSEEMKVQEEPAADPVVQGQEETKPQEENGTVAEESKQGTPEAPLKDLALMSKNLTELVNQVETFYSQMSEKEKAAISEITGSSVDVSGKLARLKGAVSETTLSVLVQNLPPEEATAVLDVYEEQFVMEVDNLRKILQDAKNYVSDYEAYLTENLTILRRQLESILATNPELFMDDYLVQIQSYYEKAIAFSANNNSPEEIIKLFDEAMAYADDMEKHLNPAVLKDGIKAGAAFAGFLKSAPASMAGQTAYSLGGGDVYTYQRVADELAPDAASYGQQLLEEYKNGQLSYASLSDYNTYYYENVMNAYQNVSATILKEVSGTIEGANAIGYAGAEKENYETALQEYQSVFAAKNYSALSGAADKLQKAADAYALAAEKYAKEEGAKQFADLKEQLVKIQNDIKEHSEYYQETYLKEVTEMIAKMDAADLDTMSGRDIIQMVTDAKAVAVKQGSSYSEKLTDLVADADSMVTSARAWWEYLSEELKSKDPYQEAVEMTNALSEALQTSNGVYDLEQLTAAYEKFASDYAKTDGKLQTAAKAVAQYVLDQAENVYAEESKKEHTEGVLKAFGDAIENLKKQIEKWDFNGTRSAVEAVKAAENSLLNDKPVKDPAKKPVKEEPDKKKDETVRKKVSPKTGDAGAVASLLAMFSLSGAAGILNIKKRRKEEK